MRKLLLCVFLCTFALVTSSAQTTTVDGLTYSVKDGEAVIIKADANLTDTVTIPAKVNIDGKDYDITAIGDNAFRGCDKFKYILFNHTIKRIGKAAFKGCTALVAGDEEIHRKRVPYTVTPEALEEIGDSAFAMTGTKELYMDESIKLDYVPNGIIDHCPNIAAFATPRFYDDDKFGDLGVIETSADVFKIYKNKRGLDLPRSLITLKVKCKYGPSLSWQDVDEHAKWVYRKEDGTEVEIDDKTEKKLTYEYYKEWIDAGWDIRGELWPMEREDWQMEELYHVLPYPTTDIDAVSIETGKNMVYYDLLGRVVNNPVKGRVYIHNGKKTVYGDL